MRILLTNDDGIDAPGLAALEKAARLVGQPIVVAPASEFSGCGHRVTTTQPVRVRSLADHRHAVEGTPADCVRVALHGLVDDTSWVLAGINAGGNLGADVHHSGTVAAIREAVLHGRPGIAFSQYRKRGMPLDWDRAMAWVGVVLQNLVQRPWQPGTYWNVNLPHLEPGAANPEIVECPLDTAPLPVQFRREGDLWHYEGIYHQRKRQPGADVEVCFNGKIAVTRLSL